MTVHILRSLTGLERLMEVATQASTTIPYYQQAFADVDFYHPDLDLSTLPLLTKELARTVQNELVRPDYLEKQPDALVAYTSGSTGIPLRLVRRHSEMIRAAKYVWKSRMTIFPDLIYTSGIMISNQLNTTLSAIGSNASVRGKQGMLLEVKIDFDTENIAVYLDEIDYHRPTWLAGPPPLLMLLAEGIKKYNRPLKTKLAFIESHGSLLTQEAKDVLAETFQCPVVNHYGCEETQTIAYECPKGQLHLFDKCVVAELHPRDGTQEYEIIVSTLIFETMPFLRYRVGDLIQVQQRSCSCSNPSAVLGQVRGRVNDIIAGTALSGTFIFHSTIRQMITGLEVNPILQYQVHQVAMHEFEVYLILSNREVFNWVTQEFQNIIAKMLPKAHFNFHLVQHINPSPGGKLQLFIRHV